MRSLQQDLRDLDKELEETENSIQFLSWQATSICRGNHGLGVDSHIMALTHLASNDSNSSIYLHLGLFLMMLQFINLRSVAI